MPAAVTGNSKKLARIDIRVDPDLKTLFNRAARLAGRNLSAFVIDTVRERARQLVDAHEQLILSDEDRDRFLEALSHAPSPNEALCRAARNYRKNQKNS